MTEPAIRVEHISKQYKIGASRESYKNYKTLRESILKVASLPLGWIRGTSHAKNQFIWALDDVSFEVKRGESVGIIGRNGAGKSTLLKVLSRITKPTRGRVDLYGRVGSLLEVGTGFHPELTGRENIFLNGAILGMSKREIDKKFDEIVDFAEIEKFLDTPVKYYSSGMYVRLAFAVSAHLEPEILVVDEVLAVGDAQFQKKCLGKMSDVAEQGRTVLFVSHNMAAVRKLCTRGILIHQGKVVCDSSVDDTINQYLLGGITDFTSVVSLPKLESETANGLNIKLYSQTGESKAEFKLFEPWIISLEFELYKQLQHVIAAVGVTTVDAFPLATFWSKPSDLAAGKYKVDFVVDFPLKSCELQFTVGLSSFERAIYYKENVGLVSISDVSVGNQPIRASGAGILLTPQDKEIQPLN